MPYLKRKKSKYDRSEKLLKAYDMSAARLAIILDCSLPTARAKKNNVGKLTTDDWDKICRFGHIPIDEIRAVILS